MRAMITGRAALPRRSYDQHLARKLITTGLAATAASAVLPWPRACPALRAHPADNGGVYGPGETMTYAVQKLLPGTQWPASFPAT